MKKYNPNNIYVFQKIVDGSIAILNESNDYIAAELWPYKGKMTKVGIQLKPNKNAIKYLKFNRYELIQEWK